MGNIWYEIPFSEIEGNINDYIKHKQLGRGNLNDEKNEVFFDIKGGERIEIRHQADDNLQISVPFKIDNKQTCYYGVKAKVSDIRLDVVIDVQLQKSSSADRLLDVNITHSSFSIKNSVSLKIFNTFPINVKKIVKKQISKKFTEVMIALNMSLDKALEKERVAKVIKKKLPKGIVIDNSVIGIGALIIKDGKVAFDIHINADLQYEKSAETLQKEFQPFSFEAELLGLKLGGYRVEIIKISMSNGIIKTDISLSGTAAGTMTTSFKPKFLNTKQRFEVVNLQFDDINTNSVLLQTIDVWPRALQDYIPLHKKLEKIFNDNLKNAISNFMNLPKHIPGNLILNKDSANITHILFANDKMTVKVKFN